MALLYTFITMHSRAGMEQGEQGFAIALSLNLA